MQNIDLNKLYQVTVYSKGKNAFGSLTFEEIEEYPDKIRLVFKLNQSKQSDIKPRPNTYEPDGFHYILPKAEASKKEIFFFIDLLLMDFFDGTIKSKYE